MKRVKKNEKGYKSRVERNSLKNRIKRRIKKLPKRLIKNIIYLVVGFAYTIYLLIRAFDNLIAKLFMKLPRWSRAIILWSLVISNVYHNFDFKVLAKEINPSIKTTEQIPQENTATLEETSQIETKQEEEYKCTLDEVSCRIKQKSIEYGVGEYANIIIAISKHETGNYTSSAFKNKKNVGGMMCEYGLITYNSLDESIDAFVKNLANNYIKQGLNTVEKIQPKYWPIDDPRDVKGLNVHWISGVNYYLSQLEGE